MPEVDATNVLSVGPVETATVPRVRPLGETVAAAAVARIRPDTMSCVGAVLCAAAGLVLALGGPFAIAAVLFPLGALCDVADGALARHPLQRRVRPLGPFVDSLCDKVGETVLLVGLLVRTGDPRLTYLLGAAYAAGFLTSYVKAIAGEHGLGLAWPEARVYGRAGRAVLLSLTLVLVAALPDRADLGFAIGFTLLAAFNVATLRSRIAKVLREAPINSRTY